MRNDPNTDFFEGGDAYYQNLKEENEILKLKIEAEFGAAIHTNVDDLPPDLEHKFLESIYNFEVASRKSQAKVPLYEIIGRPDFKAASDLTDAELETELERLQDLMFQNRVVLNTRKTYDNRTIYEFLINELFVYEMENIQVEGYYCHFSYEDFYPDHEYDLRQDAKEFIEQVLGKTLDREFNGIYDQVLLDDGRVYTCTEVYDRIMLSLSDYTKCQLNTFDISKVHFTETDAFVKFQIEYECDLPQRESIRISGEGKLGYRKDYGGYWYVSEIQIPGIVI